MHTEIKHETETPRPPLPPAAVFDEQHMAEARPVQPLVARPARKLAGAFQNFAGRRFTTIAPIIAGVLICVGIGAASVDWAPDPLSAKDDSAQAASEPMAPSTAMPASMATAARRPPQKRRSVSNPQAREAFPPLQLSDDDDDQKPRPRLVSVIH